MSNILLSLVIESRTVQSLPLSLRDEAIDAVVSLVGGAGRALVLALRRSFHDAPSGPPWPVSDLEMERYEAQGLVIEREGSVDDYFVREYVRT